MKIIAFYLPQYHAIPENDKWWGKNFTEWTNVKKAKPIYKNHYQPREPMNENYYNLLDANTRLWQSKIAKEYGIYGFCYYHYWFKGKQLLEKPMNEMLKVEEPDFPFCICWANEPWTRAWDGGNKEVLIGQEYGDINDWEEHFQYLMRIFVDKRYILIDNKPLFLIYRTTNIEKCNEMIEYWNNRIKEYGFDGIHLVEMLTSFQNKSYCKHSQSLLEFEPMYTMSFDVSTILKIKRKLKYKVRALLLKTGMDKYISERLLIDKYNYIDIWNRIIKRQLNYGEQKKVFPGAFVDWDNTPRRKINAVVFEGANPNIFEEFLRKQIEKAQSTYDSDYIFINAWNEWAEGTYLEPDQKFGYQYLEAVKKALSKK